MSARAFIDVLFPDGKPLYYSATLSGKQLSKHWLVLEQASDQGYIFQLFLELDPAAAGRGGSMVKQRCRLQLDGELRPVRYLTEAMGARAILDFGAETITATLPDGTRPELPRAGAEGVVEASMTGLDAILYASSHEQGRLKTGEPASFKLFLLNQLLTIPQNLTPSGPNRWTSGYGEEIVLDERGLLVSIEISKQGARTERQDAPPLPEWHARVTGTQSGEIVRYRPDPAATFRLEDVSISAPRGPLGASLTVPAGTGPFPAVLFIAGTGTHDRHGIAGELDIGSHEIVDWLSDHGILGLRFDSRGAGATKGDEKLASGLRPLIDDARACLTYMRGRREVDARRVILLGHSQGGLIALALAGEPADAPVRAVALLASLGRRMPEILEQQVSDQARKLGLSDAQLTQQLAEFREFIEAVRAGKTFASGELPDHLLPLTRSVDWIREHLEMEAADLVTRIGCPVFIGQGGKDFQVRVEDAQLLLDSARAAGVPAELEVFPELDHLFKNEPGESRLEHYYDRTRRVDRGFLERLLGWFQKVS